MKSNYAEYTLTLLDFRFVLASLHEALSIRRSVCPSLHQSVYNAFINFDEITILMDSK